MVILRLLLPLVLLALAACSGDANNVDAANERPSGDATRGAQLFQESIGGAPACNSCHTVDGTTLLGPSFQDFSQRAGTRLEGTSAEDYAYQSITLPASYLVSGFRNTMYNQYGQHLSDQQIADLIAYLLTF